MFDCIAQMSLDWHLALSWTVIMVFLGALFVSLINRLINNNKQQYLWILFGALVILGALIYFFTLSLSSETSIVGNELQVALVSILSSLELFFGQTHLYDGIISGVIFTRPALLCAFITVYTFSVLFTGVLLFKFITKRWDSRFWLWWHSKKANASDKRNHIFFGINRYSIMLGKDILHSNEAFGKIVYVDFPGEDENISDFSVSDLFSNLFRRSDDRLDEDLRSDERVIILKAKKHLKDTPGSENPMKEIGLSGLKKWLDNEKNQCFILSENESDNLLSLNAIARTKIEVFCHARKEGIIIQMERFYRASSDLISSRIHFVDSTFLAVETLKRKENLDLQPVRFVDIAKDKDGRKAGYVTSPFNAMILGFGETGQEMLRFMYEFGAFVGKDNEQSESNIMVFDSDLQRLKGLFLSQCPALEGSSRIKWEELQFDTQGTISTEGIRVDSTEFWKEYSDQLDNLNYVVIALGDDRVNTEIGIRLMEYRLQKGKSLDKFIILVRLTNRGSQYAQMLEFYDKYYCKGMKKLRSFGEDELIWKYEILTRASLHQEAEAYYAAYVNASGEKTLRTWSERREDILGIRGRRVMIDPKTGKETESPEKFEKYKKKRENKLSNLIELHRKEGQDYANCLHSATKLELCDRRFYDTTDIADKIPETLTPGIAHYPEKGNEYNVLEKLAIGEHIRWVASHEVMGCTYADERNELFKKNEYMVPYAKIPQVAWDWGTGDKVDQIQHYDWIVVKTTLRLANQKKGGQADQKNC